MGLGCYSTSLRHHHGKRNARQARCNYSVRANLPHDSPRMCTEELISQMMCLHNNNNIWRIDKDHQPILGGGLVPSLAPVTWLVRSYYYLLITSCCRQLCLSLSLSFLPLRTRARRERAGTGLPWSPVPLRAHQGWTLPRWVACNTEHPMGLHATQGYLYRERTARRRGSAPTLYSAYLTHSLPYGAPEGDK